MQRYFLISDFKLQHIQLICKFNPMTYEKYFEYLKGVDVNDERDAVGNNRYGSYEEGPPRGLRIYRKRHRAGNDQFHHTDLYSDV